MTLLLCSLNGKIVVWRILTFIIIATFIYFIEFIKPRRNEKNFLIVIIKGFVMCIEFKKKTPPVKIMHTV